MHRVRYKDEEAFNAHFQMDYFKEVTKRSEDEGLLAKPVKIR
jgi:quinol monooxygenase YgiN